MNINSPFWRAVIRWTSPGWYIGVVVSVLISAMVFMVVGAWLLVTREQGKPE